MSPQGMGPPADVVPNEPFWAPIAFGPARQARLHSELARDFAALERDMVRVGEGPPEPELREFEARRPEREGKTESVVDNTPTSAALQREGGLMGDDREARQLTQISPGGGFRAQTLVLTGLFAPLTGAALPEDIALTVRRLQPLALDIVAAHPHPDRPRRLCSTPAPYAVGSTNHSVGPESRRRSQASSTRSRALSPPPRTPPLPCRAGLEPPALTVDDPPVLSLRHPPCARSVPTASNRPTCDIFTPAVAPVERIAISPRRAITTSSPAPTCASSRESRVLAWVDVDDGRGLTTDMV